MRLLVALFFSFSVFVLPAQETLYYNANIFTADNNYPSANAMLVVGDTIAAIGSYEAVSKKATAVTTSIDCKGRFMMPGFVDSHIHAISGGLALGKANVAEKDLTAKELHAFALSQAKVKTAFTRDVLVLYGVNISAWQYLDEIKKIFNQHPFDSIPVYLKGSDGHTGWANSAMLHKAGIDAAWWRTQNQTMQSLIPIDANGSPTGFLKEEAIDLLHPYLLNKAALADAATAAIQYLHSEGITAILDPRAGILADNNLDYLQTYFQLQQSNRLPLHVAALLKANADADIKRQIRQVKAAQQQYNGDHLKVVGIKIFADGVVEHPTHTAALSLPYTYTQQRGDLLFAPQSFAGLAAAADSAGLLVHVHAIGDRAVTETLNGFTYMRRHNGMSDIPHTLTHLQFVLPSDIPRFKALQVQANMQLLWAFGDVTTYDMVQPYVHPSIFQWQYPARSLLQAGAMLSGSSDWPVSSANVFTAMYRAETRKGPMGVLDSTQRVSRKDMLLAYTINGAKAMRAEQKIGSLAVGKSADFIMLSHNLMAIPAEALLQVKVLRTYFAGKEVFAEK